MAICNYVSVLPICSSRHVLCRLGAVRLFSRVRLSYDLHYIDAGLVFLGNSSIDICLIVLLGEVKIIPSIITEFSCWNWKLGC